MDKDNRDDFTFAKLSDLKLPVTFRISSLEGKRSSRTFTELLEQPELRFHGAQSSYVSFLPIGSTEAITLGSRTLSDLYVTCQLVADNKPLTIPFRTSFKAFKNNYTSVTVCTFCSKANDTSLGGTNGLLFQSDTVISRLTLMSLLRYGILLDRVPQRQWELVKKHQRGDLPKSEWLDMMTFRKIEEIHVAEMEKTDKLFLYIDLPRFDFPIVFNEPESHQPQTYTPPMVPSTSQTPVTVSMTSVFGPDSNLWSVSDPDSNRENPVEDKHRRLVRSHRSSPYDRELKPNAKIRDELGEILNYSPSQSLTSEEKDLIWKFRFYLARDKRGLTKFLKSVTWRDSSEVKQAVEELLPQWTEIDTDDALELLGPGTVDSRVRAFAVKQLMRADDDELLLYLLQLVQALKFESAASEQRSARATTSAISYDDSGLSDFLIARGVANPVLGNRLYWYLMVEVALEDRVMAKMYGRVVFKFMNKILESPDGSERRELMRRQGLLVDMLYKRAREIRTSKDPRPKKIEKLRSIISDHKNGLASIPPLPLPLNARLEVTGIIAEKSSVFKSNLFPLLLYFQCTDGTEYPVIFKDGDDMRQDQLVIQLFTLMDRLLRKENLDLKLSPYHVLATGPLQGMAQFIPSKTIAAIVSEHGNLLNYLRVNNPDEGSVGTSGVEPGVIDTFVRSCGMYLLSNC
ncbi:hypothetical protein C0992_006496 [Termitomyces sp. T32_za158]|nr:hypothetical protein C0992_006496 [Termitomyces sp. T32_za158]